MNEKKSKWQTKEIAQTYVEGVRGAIPGAKLQLEIISKIVRAWCPLPSKIIDLGCGDGILGRLLLGEYPTANITFADFSEPMLGKLRNRIGCDKRATVINIDFATPAWIDRIEMEKPFDIVVSGFAIHHQTDDRKKVLYSDIYELLKEVGIFLNHDQVSSETSSISEFLTVSFFGYLSRIPIKM